MAVGKVTQQNSVLGVGELGAGYTSRVYISNTKTTTKVELKVQNKGQQTVALSAALSVNENQAKLHIDGSVTQLRHDINLAEMKVGALESCSEYLSSLVQRQIYMTNMTQSGFGTQEITSRNQKSLFKGLYVNLLHRLEYKTVNMQNKPGVINIEAGYTLLAINVETGEVTTSNGDHITINHKDVNKVSQIMALIK